MAAGESRQALLDTEEGGNPGQLPDLREENGGTAELEVAGAGAGGRQERDIGKHTISLNRHKVKIKYS